MGVFAGVKGGPTGISKPLGEVMVALVVLRGALNRVMGSLDGVKEAPSWPGGGLTAGGSGVMAGGGFSAAFTADRWEAWEVLLRRGQTAGGSGILGSVG